LDRGYEEIEKKLSNCGARIKRLNWSRIKNTLIYLVVFLGSNSLYLI
jgi:hypothetical protein